MRKSGSCCLLLILTANIIGFILLMDKKENTMANGFQKILDESGRKHKKNMGRTRSEFYNTLIKSS